MTKKGGIFMSKFVVTIDSSCDGNLEELNNKGVEVICYHYSDGITDFLDNMNHERGKKFFDNMRNGVKYTTSQLINYSYYQFFKKVSATNKNIIHISLTEGLSSSINQARMAADLIHQEDNSINIEIIDSLIACNGELVVLDKALKLQKENELDVKTAAEELRDFAPTVNTHYTTSTLAYFVRGGRLSKVAGLIGSVLKINPVLVCAPNGQLKVEKQLRGKKAAYHYIVNEAIENAQNPENQTLYICHADNIEGANEIKEQLMKEVGFKEAKIYQMGPIIGSHAGPGLIAVFYVGKRRVK